MLSKYTIALLGIAAFVFILIDRDARKWLVRPEPICSYCYFPDYFFPSHHLELIMSGPRFYIRVATGWLIDLNSLCLI